MTSRVLVLEPAWLSATRVLGERAALCANLKLNRYELTVCKIRQSRVSHPSHQSPPDSIDDKICINITDNKTKISSL